MAQSAGTTKLLCSICLEDFKIPKLLPCFHSFCLLCLESYVQQGGNTKGSKAKGKFDCPLCRAVTDIPVGESVNFKQTFTYLTDRSITWNIVMYAIEAMRRQRPRNVWIARNICAMTVLGVIEK